MKKAFGTLTLATVLLFASTTLAADRVVVIPLGKTAAGSPSSNFLAVHDNADVFWVSFGIIWSVRHN